MIVYEYKLKESVRFDIRCISGVVLRKDCAHVSYDKIDFGKLSYLVDIKVINAPEPKVAKTVNKKIRERFDFTTAKKSHLIDYIYNNTSDPLIKDKELLKSLKKKELADIILLMEDNEK
jgi:hypothetical protein